MAASLYARVQNALYHQLEGHERGRYGLSPVNWTLVLLILLSMALFTVDPERPITIDTTGTVGWINAIVLWAFAAEFAARVWVAGADPRYAGVMGRLRWLRATWFMALVDFMAFAPELLFVLGGLPPPSWLRTLRVLRLFKMARYFTAFELILAALRTSVQPLLAAITAAVITWYLAAVALFLAEHDAQPEVFSTIGDSMWWSVITLTTVGYGDMIPITTPGRIIAGFVAVLGLGTVALPSGIIAGAFMHQLRRREGKGSKAGSGGDTMSDG